MIWITGNSGAGKTTLAQRLRLTPKTIILDGDQMRYVWKDLGYSKEDRTEQNWRVARLADVFELQGFDVVVATICPYRDLRKELSESFDIEWVYLKGGEKPSKEFPYED